MTHPNTIRRTGRRLLLAAFVLAVLIIPSAQATPGALDPSFGTGGKVTTSLGPGYDAAFALALQPDGKQIAGGYTDNGSDEDFAVARYNPDGTLDTTFNGTGKVTTDIGSGDDEVMGLVLQPDGKVVAAGDSAVGSDWDFSLARYNPDGTLDTGFNGTGKVTTWFGPSSGANAVALQPDGKIVAAGTRWNGAKWDFALARYSPDGTLDTGFNGTGTVTTTIGPGIDSAYAVVVQPDGKVVVAGYSGNYPNEVLALARYKPDGTLDTSFNGTGKVTTATGSRFVGAALVLQPDGKLVVAGTSGAGLGSDFALARFNPDGTPDTSFNGTGKVTTPIGPGQDTANALVLRPDGRLVAAGVTNTGSQQLFAIVRYLPNGSLDTSFNGTGKVVTAFGSIRDVAYAVKLQPDGELIAAGYSYKGGPDEDFALARYLDSSTLTVSKSGGGSGSVTSSPNGINCGSTCSASFAGGSVTLTATPSPGSSFLGWSGACSGSGSCAPGVSADRSVTARFETNKTLTLAKSGSGSGTVSSSPAGITCGSTCAHAFRHGTLITLSATPARGSSFLGWTGACSGSGSCTLTMTASLSATARFEPDKLLTLTRAGSGSGTVSSGPTGIACGSTCAHAFRHGSVVTLSALASKSSRFAGWSGACSGTATCSVTMSAARSVTATFKALCVVPKLKGKTLRAAKRALTQAHCSVGKVTRAFSATVKKGRVIKAKPRTGKTLAAGSKIRLEVSSGKR